MSALFPTPTKAAKLLGVSRSFLYERIAAGDIVARKWQNRTLVDMAQARAFLSRLPLASIGGATRAEPVKPSEPKSAELPPGKYNAVATGVAGVWRVVGGSHDGVTFRTPHPRLKLLGIDAKP